MSIEPENKEPSKEREITPKKFIKPEFKAKGSKKNCLFPFPEKGFMENKRSDLGPEMIPKNKEKQVETPKIRTDPFILPPQQLVMFPRKNNVEAQDFEKQEKVNQSLIEKKGRQNSPKKIDEDNIEGVPITEGSETDRNAMRLGRTDPFVFTPNFDNPKRNNLRPGPPSSFELTYEPPTNRPLTLLDEQGRPKNN